ncbi:MAG TPA: hypothetical protein VLO09_04990, partial [Ornithinimicrobium sp.]|nr:hypothetical protein [Ornithinimicrobium sp.]
MVQTRTATRPSPNSNHARRRAALVLFGLVTVTVAAYPFLSHGLEAHPGNVGRPVTAAELLLSLAAGALGLVLTWARPRNRIGWLISLAGLLFALCNLGNAYGARALLLPDSGLLGGTLVLALTAPLWVGTVFLPLTLILVRYPTGSVTGTWPPRFERLALAGFALLYAGYALSPNPVTDQVAGAEPVLDVHGTVVGTLLGTGVALLLTGSALVVGDALRRAVRAERADRTALVWLLTTAPLAAGVIMLGPDNYAGTAAYVLVLVAITVGVLRYQALGIEVAVRRTLLYALLTGLVLAAFVGVSAGLAWLLPAGPAPQVIAAALIAVGLGPARGRLQDLVDRLLYGDRDDPAGTLRRLGESMNQTPSDGLVLAALANLTEALRLDGARIVGPDGSPVAEWGSPSGGAALPLMFAGETLGELRVGGRRGEHVLG